jgi:Holliday junction DNA helicase RuvA
MIGKLKGLVDLVANDHLIIDVNGVGYIVSCSGRTLGKLPSAGGAVSLLIETHVREDNISLYGFCEAIERDWFKQLITVKGVGAKLALTILSCLTPAMLSSAILAKDKEAFKQVSGVGPKLAERIITELKDKTLLSSSHAEPKANKISQITDNDVQSDAISALANLGYSRVEAYNITSKLLSINDNSSLSELIKGALKELAR